MNEWRRYTVYFVLTRVSAGVETGYDLRSKQDELRKERVRSWATEETIILDNYRWSLANI